VRRAHARPMLDDREREELEEIERALLADPGLQRRLRGRRLRGRLATPALVATVAFLAVTAVGLLLLGLPLQAVVVALIAWWPWRTVRRRTRRPGRSGSRRSDR
jgi:Flp pilus assembly protein TadB